MDKQVREIIEKQKMQMFLSNEGELYQKAGKFIEAEVKKLTRT